MFTYELEYCVRFFLDFLGDIFLIFTELIFGRF